MATVAYLDQVAASQAGRVYKSRLLAALDPRPDHVVLDVGCGPGTDLDDMSAGLVVGVDISPEMVAVARERRAAPVVAGDAHHLPVRAGSVDRVRTDRAVQHMADPAAVLAEVRRALRPGGRACLAEPDWSTLAVDPGPVETVLAFNRFVCTSVVRNPVVGRQLARLGAAAGLSVRSVAVEVPTFRDFAVADRILGLARNAERAVRAGFLARSAAEEWLAALRAGPVLASVQLFLVVLERPLERA